MKPADLDIAHTHRKLQGVFAAARDVTERKRFEQALQEKNIELERQNRRVEEANRLSEFLANMSHELRTTAERDCLNRGNHSRTFSCWLSRSQSTGDRAITAV